MCLELLCAMVLEFPFLSLWGSRIRIPCCVRVLEFRCRHWDFRNGIISLKKLFFFCFIYNIFLFLFNFNIIYSFFYFNFFTLICILLHLRKWSVSEWMSRETLLRFLFMSVELALDAKCNNSVITAVLRLYTGNVNGFVSFPLHIVLRLNVYKLASKSVIN